MFDLPELWTVQQVAGRLKVTPETVRRFVRAGRLGCYQMGGCTRVSPEQVAAYLQASLRPPREMAPTLVQPTSHSSVVEEFRQRRRIQRAVDRQNMRS